MKATEIWPYQGEVLVSQENYCCLKESVHHLIDYVIKTTHFDAV